MRLMGNTWKDNAVGGDLTSANPFVRDRCSLLVQVDRIVDFSCIIPHVALLKTTQLYSSLVAEDDREFESITQCCIATVSTKRCMTKVQKRAQKRTAFSLCLDSTFAHPHLYWNRLAE